MYWYSKFAILQVTLNFEVEEMNISSRHSNSSFARSYLLTFIALTNFAKIPIHVNYQFTP